jgi:hypothetical protein
LVEEDWVNFEDVLKVLEKSLREAENTVANPKLSKLERNEAKGAKKAYIHCIDLVKTVIDNKG